jgi:hypothetical protein
MTTEAVNDPNRPEHRLPEGVGVLDMNAGPARRGQTLSNGNRVRPLPKGAPAPKRVPTDEEEAKRTDARTPADRGEPRRGHPGPVHAP